MSGAPGVSESVAGLDDIGPTIQGSSSPSNQRLNTTGNKQAGSQIRENNEIIDLESENGVSPKKREFKKLSMLPLVFMIFYEVSGGPFGIEDAVGAAGPLLALLGFLVFPLIWSLPEALITAELGSMFPENGGYVYWVSAALGPYWGFQVGWMKWLSGVIDNAVYPGLFLDYLESSVPAFERKLIRMTTELGITTVLTFLNYRGITIVGWVAVILGVNSLVPFVIMGFLAMPKIKPKRWLVGSIKNVNWGLYLNTLFWNLNYWDNISTLTGEMKNPMKTLPKALFCALILVVFAYFFPLITTIGAIPFVRGAWNEGYFSDVAKMIGGVWLRTWIQGAAAVSNMGNFVAEMSSDSFQLLGMAECGMLPAFFAKRSRYGTPWVAILFSASGVIAMQWMSFEEIIAAENFLYCIGMLLEFYAFIRLRSKLPRASRPFKVPVGTIGAACICVPPTVLIIVVLYFSTLKVLSISIGAIVLGLLVEPLMRYCKRKNWFEFYNKSEDVGATKPEVDES